ncbi:MAG TPA: transcriptional regulator [archaeon]|nr:transcriptional regulator [archaeon]
MVSLFGNLFQAKCADCGMKLTEEMEVFEWDGRKFCCDNCKRNFRVRTNTGHAGGASCH